jgi:putative hydrolase of the HAD superfamily
MTSIISTLVFDWGNTVMQDNPQYHGKMKDWPNVHSMDNAEHILSELSKDYKIVLATNAEDSNTVEIREALDRVNLGKYFPQIFSFHDLKVKKPEVVFFHKIQDLLGSKPSEIMMIGDNYCQDIIGAKQAGWKTIWFNANRKIAPAHLPLHDLEVRHLSEIPEALKKPFYPDVQTCINWYIESGLTHTLLAHVNNVAAISYQIALWIAEKEIPVNPILAHRGGLLHDLAKLKDESQKNHAELAAEILISKNQTELSEIARRHLIGNLLSEKDRPQTWEEKIVNYADKLSEGSSIVSLDERLLALQQRYPNFAEKIKKNTPLIKDLENEILEPLRITPPEFLIKLRSALFNGS